MRWWAALCLGALLLACFSGALAFAEEACPHPSSDCPGALGKADVGLSWVMRPGDVLVNAPLGVLRSSSAPREVFLSQSQLGVLRSPPPPSPIALGFLGAAVGVVRGPLVNRIDPPRVVRGLDAQRVTLHGRGLASAVGASIHPPAGITWQIGDRSPDETWVELLVSVEPTTSPGIRSLRLLDATGRPLLASDEAAQSLLVIDDFPIVESVAPQVLAPGQRVELVVRGRFLRALPPTPLQRNGSATRIRLSPADHIDIDEAAQVNEAGTEARIWVSIQPQAVPGERRITVETASGSSSDIATAANTLRIAGPGLWTEISPLLAPALGVQKGGAASQTLELFSGAIGVARGPVITSMQPRSASRGETIDLVLTGRQLDAATGVRFEPSQGIELVAGSFKAIANEIRVRAVLDENAALQVRRVLVDSPGLTLTSPYLLDVLGAVPRVLALSPNVVIRDGMNQTIDVQGVNLAQVQSARVEPDTGIVVQSVEVLSAETARVVLRASSEAPIGRRVLRLTAPAGSSEAEPLPNNTLSVIDRAAWLTPLMAPTLGVLRSTPVNEPSVPLFGQVLGVQRGPFARSVSPGSLARGGTQQIEVVGEGLDAVQSVLIEPSEGLQVGTLQVAPTGQSLAFAVTVTADATPGLRRVVLRSSDGELYFVPSDAGFVRVLNNAAGGPLAIEDSYSLEANGQIEVAAASGLLQNDINPQGDPMFAVLRSLPARGTLQLAADGGFVYTPDADFAGTDSFQYSAGNSVAVGPSARVNLAVSELHDAVDDSYVANDAQPLVVSAADGLLRNDRLGLGPLPEIVLEDSPRLGSLDFAQDGGFTYVARSAGLEVLRYRLRSQSTLSLPANLRIRVDAINDPPVALNDAYAVNRGARLDVPATRGVLANDSDPDGDPLTAHVRTNPATGSLALNPNGSFSYLPPADFVGTVSFMYEARDPAGLAGVAEVVIVVNDLLTAVPDSYSPLEGEILFVDEVQGVLSNDAVNPVGALRVELVQAPTRGEVQLANDGSFVYSPEDPDYFGSDQFTYRLRDDRAASAPALVSLQILAVNDSPRPRDDRYLSDENAELTVTAPGVLENDIDVDSSSLRTELVRAPLNGVVTVRADGGFTFVPEVNFRGEVDFTYAALDSDGARAEASVLIDVTQPPTATNDVYFVDVDTVLVVSDPEEGLLINDHDAPENDPLTALLQGQPERGSVELNGDGTFRYTPPAGFVGIDQFDYRVTDGRSQSNVGSVTLAVGVTSFPRAYPDAYEMDEDTELLISAAEGVLINDTDADTPPEQLEAYLVGRAFQGRIPLDVTVARDGGFRVKPWRNFYGETFFVYQVFDGVDVSNAAIVTVQVNPVNDGVTAEDDAFGVIRDTVFSSAASGQRPITYNDSYDEDYPVRFEVASPPANGQIDLNPDTGAFIYTPGTGFFGTDEFVYRVFQVDTGIGDTATVRLRVNAPPVAVPDSYTVLEDSLTPAVPNPLANDTDLDGDRLRYTQGSWFWNIGPPNYVARLITVDAGSSPEANIESLGHFYGSTQIRYALTDGYSIAYGLIDLEVVGVPEPPITVEDNYLVEQDGVLTVNDPRLGVLGNDFDPDMRGSPSSPNWVAAQGADLVPLVAELVQTTSSGQLTLSGLGTFSYTPNPGYSGTDTFRYQVRDGTGRVSAVTDARIRVNSPAVAVDDAYSVNEDTVLEVPAASGLLANDLDTDGDRLYAGFASSGCTPCNGRVQIWDDGRFRYTPNRDFFGQDEFFYTVRDRIAGSSIGRVVITVLPVNDPPVTEPDTYRTLEDTVLVAPEPQGVLRNDREVDGDILVNATLIQPAENGLVLLQQDGAFTYTPAPDFNGRDAFRYRVFDTTGLSTDEQVQIHITPVNDSPIANPEGYSTRQDQVLTVVAADGVLANDTDVDGPGMSASLGNPPQHGILQLETDGSFVYEPDGFFSGVDQFTYQVDDGLGEVDAAIVLIQVQPVDPEVEITAESDFYRFAVPEFRADAPGVLANDSVSGAATLTARLVVAPTRGELTLAADGGFAYVARPGESGLDGFTYAAEAQGVSATARVTLDLVPVANLPPLVRGENYAVLEDGLLDSASLFGVLANDLDPEGAALSAELVEDASEGDLAFRPDGHFVYVPTPNFHGQDHFRYRVSDGVNWSAAVTAAIEVLAQNDAPVATDDLYRTRVDTTLQVDEQQGLLANDADIDGDPLEVELVDSPIFGQVSVEPSGAFSYVPQPGFQGLDTYRYAVTDRLARDLGAVGITVARENTAPQAVGEQYEVQEDSVLDSRSAVALTANDIDSEGDHLLVQLIETTGHGVLQLDGPHFLYRPALDFNGVDRFRYRVFDGEYYSDTVEALIRIQAVNDAPVAETDQYLSVEGVALTVPASSGVLANDYDVESDPLTASLASEPAHGMVVLDQDGGFRYQPRAGFVGRDEFPYFADDGAAVSQGRVVIDVGSPGNLRPIAMGESYELPEDTVFDTRSLASLLANDVDPEGAPLTLRLVDVPGIGQTTSLDAGHLLHQPSRDFYGDLEFVYVVNDGELDSLPATLRLRYMAMPADTPKAQPDAYALGGANALTVPREQGVLANDSDPDGDVLVAELVNAPESGTVKLGLDGSFTYQRNQGAQASIDRFRYRTRDPSGLSSEADVLIHASELPAEPDALFKSGFESENP